MKPDVTYRSESLRCDIVLTILHASYSLFNELLAMRITVHELEDASGSLRS